MFSENYTYPAFFISLVFRFTAHKMGIWSKASRTHVAHMDKGDFFSSEQSTTMKDATEVSIEHIAPDGTVTVLKGSTKVSSSCSIHMRVFCFTVLRSQSTE